jgi:GTPase SAR1 family protein
MDQQTPMQPLTQTQNKPQNLDIKIGIVGDKGVGKQSLMDNFLLKYFETDLEKNIIINTNCGQIKLRMSFASDHADASKLRANDIDCAIIMSDVSNKHLTKSVEGWYNALIKEMGNKLVIINCFNKIDIKDVDTYVFDTSLPSFDVSTKTNVGIIEMLLFILRLFSKKQNLLVFL